MKNLFKIVLFLFFCNCVFAQTDLELLDYPEKIREYYSGNNYEKGDSLFKILQNKHYKSKLPRYLQDKIFIVVDRFELSNKKKVVVVKYFKKAESFADKTYEFIVYNKKGKKIKRAIQTEKSLTNGHFICEYTKKGHKNYGGLTEDTIDYAEYKKMVLNILEK